MCLPGVLNKVYSLSALGNSSQVGKHLPFAASSVSSDAHPSRHPSSTVIFTHPNVHIFATCPKLVYIMTFPNYPFCIIVNWSKEIL